MLSTFLRATYIIMPVTVLSINFGPNCMYVCTKSEGKKSGKVGRQLDCISIRWSGGIITNQSFQKKR